MTWADVERVTLLVDLAGSLAFVLLGLWVLSLQPRRPLTSAFGLLSIGIGIGVAVDNAMDLGWLGPGWTVASSVALLFGAAGVLALALLFPRPLARDRRRRLLALSLPFGLGVPVVGLAIVPYFGFGFDTVIVLSHVGYFGARWIALALLALRYAESDGAEDRDAILVVSVALGAEMALRPALLFALALARVDGIFDPSDVYMWTITGTMLASALGLVAFWLRNAAVAQPEARRAARSVALFFAGCLPVGAAFAVLTDPVLAHNLGLMGVARIAGVVLVAYAILRRQLLGIDVRVRWAISKSTIAAVFVAVFFVGSELAQQFFGETLGSTYVGIAAAGMLVFAIAPLQRAAERLAERAVPVGPLGAGPSRTPDAAPSRQEEAYRRAVRLALRDRSLTHEEEIHLFHVAEALGVPAGRAMELRHEVEREAGNEVV